jgi:hypothetical protein
MLEIPRRNNTTTMGRTLVDVASEGRAAVYEGDADACMPESRVCDSKALSWSGQGSLSARMRWPG